jgi:hypothetical protein
VAQQLSIPPTKDSAGNVVDKYQQATTRLLILLSLSAFAVGYWFGVEGKDKAKERAAQANALREAIVGQ